MNKDDLVTINDLDEKARKLFNYLGLEFAALKKQIEEQTKPYIYWCENMSMKQAMEYTGKSKSTILAWVKDGLLTPYSIGSSSSVYYSKTEIDTLKSRWEAKKRTMGLKMAI